MPLPSSSQAKPARGLKKSISMIFLRGRNQDAANSSTAPTTATSSSTPTTTISKRSSDTTDHCITHRNRMATTIEENEELVMTMREIISSQQREIAQLKGKNKEQEEEMTELRVVGHDQQALIERITTLAAARRDENRDLRRSYQRLRDSHERVVRELLSLPASLAGPSPPAPAPAPAQQAVWQARAAEAHNDIRRLAGELDAAAASVDDEKAKVQAIRDEILAIKATSAEMAGENDALERDNEAKRLALASAPAPAPGAAPAAAKSKKKKGKKTQKK